MLAKVVLSLSLALSALLVCNAKTTDEKKADGDLIQTFRTVDIDDLEVKEIATRNENSTHIPYLFNWEYGEYSGYHRIVPFYFSEYNDKTHYYLFFTYLALSGFSDSDKATSFVVGPLLTGGGILREEVRGSKGYGFLCLPLLTVIGDGQMKGKGSATCYLVGATGYMSCKDLEVEDNGIKQKVDGQFCALLPVLTMFGEMNGKPAVMAIPLLSFVSTEKVKNEQQVIGEQNTNLLLACSGWINERYSATEFDNTRLLIPLLSFWGDAKNAAKLQESDYAYLIPLLSGWRNVKDGANNTENFVLLGGLYGYSVDNNDTENWSLWGALYSDERNTQLKRRTISVTPLFRYITDDGKSRLNVFRLFDIPML